MARPDHRIRRHQADVQDLLGGLLSAARRSIADRRGALASAARTLQAVSPLATLNRGYAVLTAQIPDAAEPDRQPVTSIHQTREDATLVAHLRDGALILRVEQVDEDNQLPSLPALDRD